MAYNLRKRRMQGKLSRPWNVLSPQVSWHPCSGANDMRGHVSPVPDADADSEELQEPLLGQDADGTGRPEPDSPLHGRSRALVPHSINRLDWEELWRVLWGNCCEGFSGILGEASTLDCAGMSQAPAAS